MRFIGIYCRQYSNVKVILSSRPSDLFYPMKGYIRNYAEKNACFVKFTFEPVHSCIIRIPQVDPVHIRKHSKPCTVNDVGKCTHGHLLMK